MSQSRADMIARINSVRVSAKDLQRVADQVAELPRELRDGDGFMYVTAQMFKPDVIKAFAVSERMYALAALLKSGSIPAWLVPATNDGGLMVSDELLAVAAQEPILFRAKQAYFHPESFLDTLLKLTGSGGRA